VVAVICDNDSIHHARKVTRYLEEHPRLELLYGVRYSPRDNPVERIWGALKNYAANTAVTWPARLRQIHSFFRDQGHHHLGQRLFFALPRPSALGAASAARSRWPALFGEGHLPALALYQNAASGLHTIYTHPASVLHTCLLVYGGARTVGGR
jgi:hypothetical protein